MALQLPMFTPPTSWRPPDLADLPSWAGAGRVGIDTETHDPLLTELGVGVRRGGRVVGVSFSIEGGPKHYLPFGHEGGDNLPKENVLAYLREQMRSFDGQLVGANLSYDLDYLWEMGCETPNVSYYRDVQVADPLIYELHHSYALDAIAKRHGEEGKDETLLREAAAAYGFKKVKEVKKNLWRLPARFVGPYAEEDADLPLRVLREQENLLAKDDLLGVWNLESKVLPVLVKMRRRGVLIDQDQLSKVEDWSLAQEREALAEVKRQTGVQVGVGEVWKPEALAPALQMIGLRLEKTSQGQWSIDKALLGGAKHPVADAVLWARKTNKLRTTFAASVRKYMTNGRIHCTFNQIAREDEKGDQKGARYGRLSAVDPNLQQQPSRDEFANMWRDIYVPEPGAIWGCNDYSQQEPRWTTHFAAVVGLPKAEEAARRYREDPTTDNHDMMTSLIHGHERGEVDDALFDKRRKYAKNIYLGLCYGEGGAKLCGDLGLPTRWSLVTRNGRSRNVEYFQTRHEAMEAKMRGGGEGYMFEAAGVEGQDIIDKFDLEVPYVRGIAKEAEKMAKKRGYIRAISGRRLHFPQRDDGSFDWTHKALNRLIQGSSADQMKSAMVAIDQEMPETFLQLQVHDETDGSYGSEAECRRVAEIQREIIPGTRVPFLVDTEMGPSWGSVK